MGTARIALLLAVAACASMAQQKLAYKAVDNPQFIPASEATFLGPQDRVMGIAASNVAKAYPAAILAQHGVVNDRSPDGPIAITW